MKKVLMPVAALTPVLVAVLLMVLFAPATAFSQGAQPPTGGNLTPPSVQILDLSGQPLPGGGNETYQQYTADFTATGTSATITFAFRDDVAYISFANVSVVDVTADSAVPLANNDFSQGVVGSTPTSWTWANPSGQGSEGVVQTGPSYCYTELYCWYDGSSQGYDTISTYINNNPTITTVAGHNYQISFYVAEDSFCSTNGNGLTCNFSDQSSSTISGTDVVVYVAGGTALGTQTLTLALLDGGTGTVTDNVGTLTASNCYEEAGIVYQNGAVQTSGTCTVNYPVGTALTLTAAANVPSASNPPSTFGAPATSQSAAIPGWGGACSPTKTNPMECNLTMNSAESAAAAFVLPGLASSETLTTSPTTFPFNGGYNGTGGFDFTGQLAQGSSSTTGVVNAVPMDPLTCNTIIDAAFPGAYCFVYQLGPSAGEPPDSAQMFELTCPALPGGMCGTIQTSTFFATLSSDFTFNTTENPGLSTSGAEGSQTLEYGGGNPYVGVVKFEGPDPYHPCYLPSGETAPSPSNQVISFNFVDGNPGAKPATGGSAGTGSCWIITYNMLDEVPTVSITAGPTNNQDIPLYTPTNAAFTCTAANTNPSNLTPPPVPYGPFLTVSSCTLTDTYTGAGSPAVISATAGSASANGSGAIDTSNPGPHTLVATVMDSAENTISTSTITYNVQGSSSTVVSSSPNPSTYGQLVTFTATVSGVGTPTGQVTWTGIPGCTTTNLTSGVAMCSTSSLAASGTPYAVTANYVGLAPTYAGDSYNGTSMGTLAGGQLVNPASQSITFTTAAPGSLTVGGATYTPMATGGASGLPVMITLDGSSSGCSLSGGVVTATQSGTCVIDANQAGNSNYNAAPQVQQSFPINKANQSITWTSTAPASLTVGGATYTPMATGGASGLPVMITLDGSSSGCSLTGGVVTATAAGTCIIDANQAGNNSYNAATQVQQSFPINKANQSITWTSTAPASLTVGGATYTPMATGGASGLPVVISLDASSTGCSLTGGVVTATAAGTCVIDANQAGNNSYNAAAQVQQSFPINKANQSITWTSTAPASLTVGGATYTPMATGEASGLPVMITLDGSSSGCSLSGGVVTATAFGTCVVDANQAGNNSYNAAPQVQQSFPINKANQTVKFTSTAPASLAVGATYTPMATGGASGQPVVISLDASSTGCSLSGGVVTGATAGGTCIIDANQAGNNSYNAAPQVQQSFPITAPPTLTISPASWNFGPLYVGQSKSQTFTVTNPGTTSIAISSITIPGNNVENPQPPGDPDDFKITSNKCGSTLAAGAQCTVTVTFIADSDDPPLPNPGNYANLTIADNAGTGTQTAYMSVRVINPKVSLWSSSVSFGKQTHGTTSAAVKVTLTNSGTGVVPLTLGTISVTAGSADFELASGSGTNCVSGGTVAAGASCAIYVTFTPAAKGTTYSGTVTITDNAQNSPQSISLSGTGN